MHASFVIRRVNGTHTHHLGRLDPSSRPHVPSEPHTVSLLILSNEIPPSGHLELS